jgi:1,4-dihydroxy-2-naphthoate octaprenyltransferase
MKAFAGVARAPFLLLPVTLIAAGAAAGAYTGAFDLVRTIVALVGLVALHMAVNILNEWSDMRTGIDLETRRTPFSGGSGTLPAGAISLRATLVFGLACAAVGLAAGVWLLTEIGTALVPFMVVGAVFVLGYTDALARVGIGEIAAGLGLGGLPVAGAALVQDGVIGAAAVAAAIPATFMTFNLLLLNEFPDEAADRSGGRRNLILIFGRPAGAWIFAIAGLATPVSIIAAVLLQALPLLALAAALPTLLLVPALKWAFSDPAQPVPIPALGGNVSWNLATNTVMALSLLTAALL